MASASQHGTGGEPARACVTCAMLSPKQRSRLAKKLKLQKGQMPLFAVDMQSALEFGVPKVILRLIFMMYLAGLDLEPDLDGAELYAGRRAVTRAFQRRMRKVVPFELRIYVGRRIPATSLSSCLHVGHKHARVSNSMYL